MPLTQTCTTFLRAEISNGSTHMSRLLRSLVLLPTTCCQSLLGDTWSKLRLKTSIYPHSHNGGEKAAC